MIVLGVVCFMADTRENDLTSPQLSHVIYYIDVERRGQIVVEVGNNSQGNKLWGEGSFRLRMTGRADAWDIVTE
ncbi:hypothetical protein V8C34DRAFT_291111 [Trichoderma compactum]